MFTITLNANEIAVLGRQHPSTKRNGGWQGLLVTLQEHLDQSTGGLVLTPTLLDRIRRYAFTYGNGGWENRLMAIFQRTLGPDLSGRATRAA